MRMSSGWQQGREMPGWAQALVSRVPNLGYYVLLLAPKRPEG